MHFAFQQQRIGAQVNEFFTGDDALNNLWHFIVYQWLATGNRYNRCAAFVNGCQTVYNTQTTVQRFLRVINLAASGTLQVATKQGFQH